MVSRGFENSGELMNQANRENSMLAWGEEQLGEVPVGGKCQLGEVPVRGKSQLGEVPVDFKYSRLNLLYELRLLIKNNFRDSEYDEYNLLFYYN